MQKKNVSQTLKNTGKELISELGNSSKLSSDCAAEKNPKEDNEPRMDPCPLQSPVKEQEFIPGPSSAYSPPWQRKNSPFREKPSTVPCGPIMKCNSDVPSVTGQEYQDILCSPDNNPTKKVKLKDLAKLYSKSQKLDGGKKNVVASNGEEKCTIISNTGVENSNGNISYKISGSAKYDDSTNQTSGSAKYDDSTNQTSGSAKYIDSGYQTSGSAKSDDSTNQTSGSAKYEGSGYQDIMIVSRTSNYADTQVIEGNPKELSCGNIDCNSCATDSLENAQDEFLYSPLQDTDVCTAYTQDTEQHADKKEINIQGNPLNQESEKCPKVFPVESIIKQVDPESKFLPWSIEESSSGKNNCNDNQSILRIKSLSVSADDDSKPTSKEPLTTIVTEMSVSESDVMPGTKSISEGHEQISGNGNVEGEDQESSITWSSLSRVKARTMLRAADSLSKDSISTRFKSGSFSGKESEKEMEKFLLTKSISDFGKPEDLQPVTKTLSGSAELTKSLVILNSIDSDSSSEVFVSSDDIHQSKSFQQYYSNKRSMSATSSQALDNHQPKNRPSSKPFNPFPIKHVNQNRARTGVKLGLYKMSTLEEFEKNIRQPVWGK